MPHPHEIDEQPINPVWVYRGLPCLAAILIALAMFVFKSSSLHDLSIGGALGLLIGYCAYSFQIKRVILKDTPQPSDVTRYPLT